MSSSAGLADSAKRSRIKRKAVRPPVAGRPFPAPEDKPHEIEVKQEEPVSRTIEPSEVEAPRPVQPEPARRELEESPGSSVTEEQSTSKPKSKKKKAVVKKIGHTQPRFEVRLSGDHEKLVEDIQRKAFRETLPANKGINNSEIFGGFLEAIRPFRKSISFTSLDFKRGKLYGDGTEKIKVEVGKSIQRSSFEYFLSAIESGGEEVVVEVLRSLSQEQRERLASKILTSFEEAEEDERLVANS